MMCKREQPRHGNSKVQADQRQQPFCRVDVSRAAAVAQPQRIPPRRQGADQTTGDQTEHRGRHRRHGPRGDPRRDHRRRPRLRFGEHGARNEEHPLLHEHRHQGQQREAAEDRRHSPTGGDPIAFIPHDPPQSEPAKEQRRDCGRH